MNKISGWTKKPFIGCDTCKEEKTIVCQATRYTIKRKGSVAKSEWVTRYYCNHHADLVYPPEKRLEHQKKKELERIKERSSNHDDRDRDWYYVSGANRYL